MTFIAVSETLLFLLASCAAKQNCSEVQCKLVPVSEDAASKFQRIKDFREKCEDDLLETEGTTATIHYNHQMISFRVDGFGLQRSVNVCYQFVIRLRYSISGPSETSSERHGCEVGR